MLEEFLFTDEKINVHLFFIINSKYVLITNFWSNPNITWIFVLFLLLIVVVETLDNTCFIYIKYKIH